MASALNHLPTITDHQLDLIINLMVDDKMSIGTGRSRHTCSIKEVLNNTQVLNGIVFTSIGKVIAHFVDRIGGMPEIQFLQNMIENNWFAALK